MGLNLITYFHEDTKKCDFQTTEFVRTKFGEEEYKTLLLA
jgi:hypothetical protein